MDSGAENYRRFLAGDDTGLTDIIREYRDGLVFYLNSYVSDLHVAEELVEETFVKLVLKKPRNKEIGSFKTWLYTIARHVAVDHYRKTRKHRTVSLEEVPVGADESNLEIVYLREERKIQLHRALRRLKPTYRQALWLMYFEGFSHKQLATVMGKSVHSVETLVYRARQSLKTELLKEGFDYEEL